MEAIILLGAVLTIFYLATAILALGEGTARRKREQSMDRLSSYLGDGAGPGVQLLKQENLSAIPWVRALLSRLDWVGRLARMHRQANLKTPVAAYILLSLTLCTAGFLGAERLSDSMPARAGAAATLGALPILYIRLRRNRRMADFEKQLPEALDLIARALRSGHTVPGGIKLVAEEFKDPIGTEFGLAQDEISFGLSVQEALENMNARMDSQDFSFFVISVNLQRESGGNLCELVENIARLIRDRFSFKRKVKALTAEGRLSVLVLMLIPILIMIYKMFTIPGDLPFMLGHPMGRLMLEGGVAMMVSGFLVIRRMIKLDV